MKLSSDAEARDRYTLLAGDPDLFNRWEAGQDLARALILSRASGKPDEVGEERYAEAVGRALGDQASDPAFKALLLALPSEPDLALAMAPADPAALHEAREALRMRLSVHLTDELKRLHAGLQEIGEFSPDAAGAGRRALRNAALDLSLLAANPRSEIGELAYGHFEASANMTDAMGGLAALTCIGGDLYERALGDFLPPAGRMSPWSLDKWFAIQARDPSARRAGPGAAGLTAHPAFEAKNPNRLRALVSTFAGFNPVRFHDPSGSGYRFLADQILATDGFNPMTAARLVEPLGGWRRYKARAGRADEGAA